VDMPRCLALVMKLKGLSPGDVIHEGAKATDQVCSIESVRFLDPLETAGGGGPTLCRIESYSTGLGVAFGI
jgi:hypothetical protein